MGKKCRKCLTKYDETWGVCLMCGTELDNEEHCKDVCDPREIPGVVDKRTILGEKAFGFVMALSVLIIFVFVLAFFTGADLWTRALEEWMMNF